MPRALFLVAALLLTGCGGLLSEPAGGQQRNAPEVFEFVMLRGSGLGPRAEQMAADVTGAQRIISGSALHLASVETPFGRTDFVSWAEPPQVDMPAMRCLGHVSSTGGGASCSSGPDPVGNSIVEGGGESDGWYDLTFFPPDLGTLVVLTVEDGTMYRVIPANGVGYVQWPSRRGGPVDVVVYDTDGMEMAREGLRGWLGP